ncbi:hypothetical protein R3P38DRAFT_2797728 [Favolaschia claudopus]|uniref:Uncharacterized protein n=1 Tax=Favolaschia claudopus TaxID=2862362 RepID=A0AAW0A280_9AGAR
MSFPSAYTAIPPVLPFSPFALPSAQPVVVVVYAQPPPAPATAPKVKEHKEAAPSAPKEAVAAAPKDKTAGFPAPLIELLRTDGPFLANEVFSVAPTSPLQAVPEETPAKEWYAVFRGRFVGVVNQYALADFAVAGVGQGARKMYDTQSEALAAFNDTLTWGGVIVL